jgi:predicted transcriptional regulator
MKKMILLSIKPDMAEWILKRQKKWEYRRQPPKTWDGLRVIMYASGCKKQIVGEFMIAEILTRRVNQLIDQTIHETPQTEKGVRAYFRRHKARAIGHALRVKRPRRYSPISLARIRRRVPGFNPPQNYRYLTDSDPELKRLIDLLPS